MSVGTLVRRQSYRDLLVGQAVSALGDWMGTIAFMALTLAITGSPAAGLTRTRVGRALASRWMGVQVAPRWTNPEPPIGLVPQVRAPVAFLHGAADRFVPASAAAELYEVANEPRSLQIVPAMGHAFAPQSVAAIRDAVDWVLDPSMRAHR